ncbi:MAG: glycosyltransferase family 39 protein [Bacteroidetes bacterium]|nr:glycosyltransferase family 39 protein [Bacteroidota bacterium]
MFAIAFTPHIMVSFLQRNYRFILVLIPALSMLMHLHVFKLDLVGIHVWRQTETQTVINNFYREDFNILHPKINREPDTDRIFRMEFPIMQWLFALFYKFFGNHIAISRVLTFMIGLGSVYGMYSLAKGLFKNKAVATICAWAFNFSPVFYYYTLNPLPDNFALCMAIWSLALFVRYCSGYKLIHIILSALLLSLATSAKLPFILFGAFIGIHLLYLLIKKEIGIGKFISCALTYLIALSPSLWWYYTVIPTWKGNGIVAGVTSNSGSIAYITHILSSTLISILPELLINYGSVLFFLAGFYYLFATKRYKHKYFPALLSCSLAVTGYYLFEINMIELVHDYYLFPFLPLIFLIVAYGAYQLLNSKHKTLKTISLVALCLLPLTAFLRADSRWDTKDPGFNAVLYHNKDEIRNIIPQESYCVTGNDESGYINLYYLDRKGWNFSNDNLTNENISFYISKGAQYLVSDSKVDTTAFVQSHIEKLIFEKDNLRIYKLK